MNTTAHGYVILGGFKLVTNLKETKEAKCKMSSKNWVIKWSV